MQKYLLLLFSFIMSGYGAEKIISQKTFITHTSAPNGFQCRPGYIKTPSYLPRETQISIKLDATNGYFGPYSGNLYNVSEVSASIGEGDLCDIFKSIEDLSAGTPIRLSVQRVLRKVFAKRRIYNKGTHCVAYLNELLKVKILNHGVEKYVLTNQESMVLDYVDPINCHK
jgi:hypothetical protein